MSKKENKKIAIKFIIPLAVVLLLILGWVLFLNIWAVKPSNEIRSIKLRVLENSGYSDVVIADRDKISEIRDLVFKLQNNINITNIAAVRDAEKYQKDPQFAMIFECDGNSQEVCVHKDIVVIFDDNHKYFLQLENMNAEDLINILNSYSV